MNENSVKNMTYIYGWDYDGIFKKNADGKKLYARFFKGDKILYRVIHKGNRLDYIRHDGRIFYFTKQTEL